MFFLVFSFFSLQLIYRQTLYLVFSLFNWFIDRHLSSGLTFSLQSQKKGKQKKTKKVTTMNKNEKVSPTDQCIIFLPCNSGNRGIYFFGLLKVDWKLIWKLIYSKDVWVVKKLYIFITRICSVCCCLLLFSVFPKHKWWVILTIMLKEKLKLSFKWGFKCTARQCKVSKVHSFYAMY